MSYGLFVDNGCGENIKQVDRMVIVSCIFFCFYGKHIVLDYLIIICFFALLFWFFSKRKLEIIYLPLVFFEAVLVLPFGGSFFRIYEVVYILYFICIKRCRIVLTKKLVLFLIYIFINCVYSFNLTNVFSIVINALMVYMISLETESSHIMREQILSTIAYSSAFSGIYGFVNIRGISFEYGMRYSGTMNDPNYSALLYGLGLVSVLCCKSLDKKYRLLLFAVLALSLARTISLSGIIAITITVLVISYIKNRRKSILIVVLGIVAFFVFLSVPLPNDFFLSGIQSRIKLIFSITGSNNYSALTSGRSELSVYYLNFFLNNIDVFGKLFGGHNTVAGVFRDSMVEKIGDVSHNGYIDMIFMNGLLGALFVVLWMFAGVIHNIKMFKLKDDDTFLGFLGIKCIVMIMCISLSIYPFRYFNLALWI